MTNNVTLGIAVTVVGAIWFLWPTVVSLLSKIQHRQGASPARPRMAVSTRLEALQALDSLDEYFASHSNAKGRSAVKDAVNATFDGEVAQ